MEKIQHKYLDVRGLKLHVAEIGTGLLLKFLLGAYFFFCLLMYKLFVLKFKQVLLCFSFMDFRRFGTHGSIRWSLLLMRGSEHWLPIVGDMACPKSLQNQRKQLSGTFLMILLQFLICLASPRWNTTALTTLAENNITCYLILICSYSNSVF